MKYKEGGSMLMSRCEFMRSCAAITAGLPFAAQAEGLSRNASVRKFHLSISPDALNADHDLLKTVHAAGVSDIWLTGYMFGSWHYPLEEIRKWADRVEKEGMAAHIINIPLGHPGSVAGDMPPDWKPGVRPNGSGYYGTSLHPPATCENADAMRRIESAGFTRVFLDDDFRLAQSPGAIGGCFCDYHRDLFMRESGFLPEKWKELLDAVTHRNLTPELDAWLSFSCDQLTNSFRIQQKSAPKVQVGIMVMYLGSEKAGIRLSDYRNTPFRVGEMMFDDDSFGSIKAKTNELFSALFHRRFVRPELAFSETTAYPADRLSAANMAAKLTVSTIADVRNTMYMSGLTAFPRTYWESLGPAMKKQEGIHRRIAGHQLRGPFKHYWGERSRKVGDDNPFSLFLAMGIPFEVIDTPAHDGWTFLSDFDARVPGGLLSAGTVFVSRKESDTQIREGRVLSESLEPLFAFKREIAPRLSGTPYVEEKTPVVCAWYPTAHAVLLWNLTEERQTLTVRRGDVRRSISVDALDSVLMEA